MQCMRLIFTALYLAIASVCVPPSSSAAANAVPADFGFPVPAPEPALPDNVEAFEPPLLNTVAEPEVAEWTRTAGPDEAIVMAGQGFSARSHLRFFAQGPDGPLQFDRTVIAADNIGASAILPDKLPPWSTYLVWPANGESFGRPIAVNRTDAWWVGPDVVVSGDKASVYGRNLAFKNGREISYIYLKPAGAPGQYITADSVNPYRVSFVVPPLSAGDYELWVHNGHAGHFGWSGPLKLTVLSASPFSHWGLCS